MQAKRVLKFGGAALADGQGVRRACAIIASQAEQHPVVVVSAHLGVTDQLEQLARAASAEVPRIDEVRVRHRSLLAQLMLEPELLDRHWRELEGLLLGIHVRGALSPGELDLVLSFGERLSARICAEHLRRTGVDATPVDAWDLGFVTDSNHGRARPLAGIGSDIAAALQGIPGVPIVTGFLAKDPSGALTTLGRNGSDLTASLIAEAVGAREMEFWKSVGGILSADPEIVPDAHLLPRLTYDEAAELAFHGARVLHPASVAPALRASVRVRVRDVQQPGGEGTVFDREQHEAQQAGPLAIASKRSVLRLGWPVDAPDRRSERAAQFFSVLERFGVQSGLLAADGQRVSAVIDPGPGLPAVLDELGEDASVERGLATLAVIGRGVGRDRDLGLRAHALLMDAGLGVLHAALGERELSQAFLVRAQELEQAVRLLHTGLLAPAR